MHFKSLLLACVVHAVVYVASVNSQSTTLDDPSGCVMTDTACPCSIITPTAVCINHHADEMCTMGACKPSYRCDCMGYEMCNRSQCAIYTADGSVDNNTQSTPFECHLTAGAAICTDYHHVIDTLEAVGYAAAQVDEVHGSAIRLLGDSSSTMHGIEDDAAEVDDALRSIEPYLANLTAQETHGIELEAEIVSQSLAEALRLQQASSEMHLKLHDVSVQVEGNGTVALQAASEVANLEQQLQQARGQSKSEARACTECSALQASIEMHTRVRQEAASRGGHDARNTRADAADIGQYAFLVHENRARSIAAKTRVLEMVTVIVTRMSTSQIGVSHD